MKKKGFTLSETAIVLIVISAIAVTMLHATKFDKINSKFIEKSAKRMVLQLEYATKQILARDTLNYSFFEIIANDNSIFSIVSPDADEKLMEIYGKYLIGIKDSSVKQSYLDSVLKDENGTETAYTLSDFPQQMKIKNGSYIAFRLNGNCTTSEDLIYNPILPNNRYETNSCGLMFFDVNTEDFPNALGVDQFILSIGRFGIK